MWRVVTSPREKMQKDTSDWVRVAMTSTIGLHSARRHKHTYVYILVVATISGSHHQFRPLHWYNLPIVNFHGQQEALWKSKSVDISQWRQ